MAERWDYVVEVLVPKEGARYVGEWQVVQSFATEAEALRSIEERRDAQRRLQRIASSYRVIARQRECADRDRGEVVMTERRTHTLALDADELNTLWHALYQSARQWEDEACRAADDGDMRAAAAASAESHRLRSLRLRVTAALNVVTEKREAA